MSDDVSNALVIDRIRVRRMHGLPWRDLQADDLAGGINVIHGPNASGKTTLALALHASLWPELEEAREAELTGHFRLNGSRWRVDVRSGRATYQEGGAKTSPPPFLPGPEERDRYWLNLQELLETTNGHFAEAILQEAAGGYDPMAAAKALKFKIVSPRSSPLTERVTKRLDRLRQTQTRQKQIWERQKALKRLRRELDAARKAERELAALRQALDYAEAVERARTAEEALGDFPDVLARMTGDEDERLEALRSRKHEAENDLERARRQRSEAEAKLTESLLPEDGLPDAVLPKLKQRAQTLRRIEDEIATKAEERERARAAAEREWQAIEGHVAEEQAAALDLDAFGDLSEFVREAESARAHRRALEALKERFDVEVEGEPERLREATRQLERWLTAASSNGRHVLSPTATALLVLGALLSAGGAAWAGLTLHPASLAFGLSALLVLAGYVLVRRKGSAGAGQKTYQHDFKATGLAGPAAWNPDAVRRRLDELRAESAELSVQLAKREEWSRHLSEWKKIREQKKALERRQEELTAALGLSPSTDEGALFLLVRSIARWQEAAAKVTRREAALQAARERQQSLLGEINDQLSPFGLEAASADDVEACRETLQAALHEFEEAQASIDRAQKNMDAAEKQRSEIAGEITAIFESLGLEEGDDAGLIRLVDRYPEYEKARRALDKAQICVQQAADGLEDAEDYAPELKELPAAELRAALEKREDVKDSIEELSSQIGGIEKEIENAKRQHDVEVARVEYEAALRALSRERVEDYRKTIGAVLARHVRDQTRNQELPAVFHRASDLFQTITRHRYTLEMDERNAAFLAYDVVQDRGFDLDELSSGTRVQLLLAVRIAFVEQQERGVRLPLVLDETLANSDDERARLIIEALQEIAREGRQVFYFTAQNDEVAKWHSLENGCGVPHRYVPVDGDAAPSAIEAHPTLPPELLDGELPDPSAHSYAGYGRELRLPPWNPRTPLGALHLWHLFDETERVHALLERGICTWGQLRTLVDQAGPKAAGLSKTEFRRVRARARAIEAWAKAWLVGRGRLVDRSVLEASGAVTDNFIEEVAALCEELGGRADALLEALEARRIKRFHTSKIEELRGYLLDEGFLDERPVLSPDEVWTRVLAAVAEELSERVVDAQDLTACIERTRRSTSEDA